MVQLVNVGGIPNQPALDLCNDVLQTLLSASHNWKFNKAEIPPFTTIPNQQDYWMSGCGAWVPRKASVALNSMLGDPPGLVPHGDMVVAHFNRFAPHGVRGRSTNSLPLSFAVGDWVTITGAGNNVYNGRHLILAASRTSFVFKVEPVVEPVPDGGQGINSLGWLEHANLEDHFNTAFVKPNRDILVVSGLSQESIIQPPFKVCVQFENVQNCGQLALSELLIRFWPVPSSQIWRAFLFYQKKAPVKQSLDENWAPWPDDLAYVLRSGLYAKALDHGEDPRSTTATALWQQDIAKALAIKDREERHEAFFPDLPILRGG
jgi:hypothetical protein